MSTKTIKLSDGTDTLLPESAVSGTNYCKMADGTLIQWGYKSGILINSDAEVGQEINFPIPFNSSNNVLVCVTPQTALVKNFQTTVTAIKNTSFEVYVYSSYSTAANLTVGWIAIGRWK